jgi:hypothetical protein
VLDCRPAGPPAKCRRLLVDDIDTNEQREVALERARLEGATRNRAPSISIDCLSIAELAPPGRIRTVQHPIVGKRQGDNSHENGTTRASVVTETS